MYYTSTDTVSGESMYLFNLSSLRPSEQLLHAEIHVYKRRLRPWVKKLDLDLQLFKVAPHYLSQVCAVNSVPDLAQI